MNWWRRASEAALGRWELSLRGFKAGLVVGRKLARWRRRWSAEATLLRRILALWWKATMLLWRIWALVKLSRRWTVARFLPSWWSVEVRITVRWPAG